MKDKGIDKTVTLQIMQKFLIFIGPCIIAVVDE